jgi:hypothetical protein
MSSLIPHRHISNNIPGDSLADWVEIRSASCFLPVKSPSIIATCYRSQYGFSGTSPKLGEDCGGICFLSHGFLLLIDSIQVRASSARMRKTHELNRTTRNSFSRMAFKTVRCGIFSCFASSRGEYVASSSFILVWFVRLWLRWFGNRRFCHAFREIAFLCVRRKMVARSVSCLDPSHFRPGGGVWYGRARAFGLLCLSIVHPPLAACPVASCVCVIMAWI